MSGNPVKTDSIQVDRIFMIIQECCSNLGRNKLFIEFITMPTDRPCFPRTSKICQFDKSGRAEVEVPKQFFSVCLCEFSCKKSYQKSPHIHIAFFVIAVLHHTEKQKRNIFRTRKLIKLDSYTRVNIYFISKSVCSVFWLIPIQDETFKSSLEMFVWP